MQKDLKRKKVENWIEKKEKSSTNRRRCVSNQPKSANRSSIHRPYLRYNPDPTDAPERESEQRRVDLIVDPLFVKNDV